MRWTEMPSAAAAGAFAFVAWARGARAFHPVGRAYRGVAHVRTDVLGSALPAFRTGSFEVVLRLSRGAGLPHPLPDVLGLAIKFRDLLGNGRDQDLLLASAAGSRIFHLLLRPARSFTRTTFSSILPQGSSPPIVFGAEAAHGLERMAGSRGEEIERLAAEGILAFNLMVAPLGRPWDDLGIVRVEDRLSQEAAESLRFDPWHTHPDLRPAGPLNKIRAAAYEGSRRGREQQDAGAIVGAMQSEQGGGPR